MARTMSALELVHAFHCTRHICPDSTCAEAKDALRRVEAHCLTCSLRIIERDAEDGTPAQCKMCRLWAALHRTRLVSTTAVCQPCEFAPKLTDAHARGVQSAVPKYHDDIVGLELRADRRAQAGRRVGWSDGMCSSVWFKARQRVRQLGPAQMKQLLMHHVRECRNTNCATCQKLRSSKRAKSGFFWALPASPPASMDFMPPRRPNPHNDCAICCDELGIHGAYWTCPTCCQALHSNCWSYWAVRQPTCPLCRASASFRRYD